MTAKQSMLNSNAMLHTGMEGYTSPSQTILQIPSADNECDQPTLLVCSEEAELLSNEQRLVMITLDNLFEQAKQNYADDPVALQRFSYYLVLKAKELSST